MSHRDDEVERIDSGWMKYIRYVEAGSGFCTSKDMTN